MLVALEGLEGVGKTSLGERVAARLGALYVKTPPPELNAVRSYVSGLRNPLVNFYFYLSGLYALQDQIAAGLIDHGCVIVDRYLTSTIAYHDEGRAFSPPPFKAVALRRADLLVRVTCDETLRHERLVDRGFHIYERNGCDEQAIDRYFAQTCHLEFRNEGSLEESTEKLQALISSRLRKDKQPLH